jgi:hypothetical protein
MTPNPFEQLRLLHSVPDPKTAFEDVAAILLFLGPQRQPFTTPWIRIRGKSKQDRSPERGRPSRIEGARRLRMDADCVALFS